jgi:hypothetical protein
MVLAIAFNPSMGAWLQRHQPTPGIHPVNGGGLTHIDTLGEG